jgi:FkbM family methyltransferase
MDKNNITFNLGNSENAACAVLQKEEYNFYGLADEKFAVIDIGLNIGLTSLYLSQKKEVTQVYGFEPFKETFRQAEENLKLNPELAKKISIFNFGLGNRNETKTLHYNPEKPGMMSTVVDRFPTDNTETNETIEIRKASEVLLPIIEQHSENIMLKMDCEGAEHYILPDLAVSGVLQKIKIIIMEWHVNNPEFYVRLLRSNGFTVFCTHEIVNYQGIIRAVRQAN